MTEKIETPWMTPEQVRAYLGNVSESTLHRYRAAGLPVHYVGGTTPRYHRDEVDEWIRSQSEQ